MTYRYTGLVCGAGIRGARSSCHVWVKLHPVAAGHELGYELALAEHPTASVSVVREGDLYKIIRDSDCIVTWQSTVAYEAVTFASPPSSELGRVNNCSPLVPRASRSERPTRERFGECVERLRTGEVITEEAFAAFGNAGTPSGRMGSRAHRLPTFAKNWRAKCFTVRCGPNRQEGNMKALVTGGAGFIGSNLVELLVAEGHQVIVLDDLSSGYRENLWPDAEFAQGDVAAPGESGDPVTHWGLTSKGACQTPRFVGPCRVARVP